MKKIYLALLILAVGIAMSACAGLSRLTDSGGGGEFVAGLAIQYATMRTIEKSHDPKAAAQKVVEIAQDVKSGLRMSDNVPVALLIAGLKAKIPYDKMEPAQALLATALVDLIGKEVNRRLDNKTLNSDAAVRLAMVADVVIDTAERMR